MKTKFILFLTCLLGTLTAQAHYLWIETNTNGKLGQSQEVRVHYGEYTYFLGLTKKYVYTMVSTPTVLLKK